MDADPLNLRQAPEALSRSARLAVWALSVAVAITRWPAISRSLWDWDEALFALAMRGYDVTLHHPHPPGFPLFIGIAHLVPLDPFHALQCVTVVASLFVFPAMFFLCRELRARPFVAIAAALLLAFFPNVWFYGGTALSDVPSMVLSIVACALLLRGCRSNASLIGGAVVLAIAAGFRPQNLIIGFVPAVLAMRCRWRAALVGAVVGALIILASYGTAASLSGGWDAYRTAVSTHERYIRSVDSFLAPRHPGLLQVADDFFVRPYRAPLLNVVVTLLVCAGFVRRRHWLALAMFGPFLLLAWLFLDFHSASRFSIAYMPLFALFAAEGIPLRLRNVVLAAVVGISIVWTLPALWRVHTTIAPPVAAMNAARESARGASVVYVDERLAPYAALLLPGHVQQIVKVVPPLVADPDAVLVREGASASPGALNFTRSRARLDGIARSRYFEVSVVPRRRPL